MSLMGYTEQDVISMMAGIRIAKSYVPLNSSNDAIHQELTNAYDFFDGMLMEGRI